MSDKLKNHSTIFARICRCLALGVGLTIGSVGASAVAQPAAELPVLDIDKLIRWDFSGSWEKDYSRSDHWMDELKRAIELQREAAEREQRRLEESRRYSRSGITLGSGGTTGVRPTKLVDQARLAEYISRQSTLRITQNEHEVRIEREGDAPLVCGIGNDDLVSFSSSHGYEVCGWNKQNLVFKITLPDDLLIWHQFSVAGDANSLRMVTGVSSKGSDTFRLVHTFTRYEEPADEFSCVQTLSRGKVCKHSEPEGNK